MQIMVLFPDYSKPLPTDFIFSSVKSHYLLLCFCCIFWALFAAIFRNVTYQAILKLSFHYRKHYFFSSLFPVVA